MAGDQIGTASVAVEADATPFQKGVDDAVQDAGKKAAPQAQKAGSRIGAALGTGLKAAGAAAGAGVAAVLSASIVKGFARLSSIDQAQAKLRGLGVTGQALTSVMNDALASVKGTAFGLDEAVSAVPGLLAAGVKPGQQLEQALKNMGSAATLAGTSFAEVSDVFADAAASGGATTDTFNRMAARGIPALQMVADHMGITREEAAKMASQGKIDFATFQDALSKGIGPAALEAGTSFQGMLQNIGAAMGRFGAVLDKPVFDGLKAVMPSVISLFDRLTEAVKPLSDAAGPKVLAFFEGLAGFLDRIDFSGLSSSLGAITPLFAGLAIAMTPLLGSLPLIGNALGPLATMFSPLTFGILGLVTALATIKPDALISLLDSIVDAIPGVVSKLTAGLGNLIGKVIPTLVSNLLSNLPILLSGVLQIVLALVQAFARAIPLLIGAFLNLIPQLVTALMTAVPQLVSAIVVFVPQLITALVGMIPNLVSGAMLLFQSLVQAVVQVIPLIIQALITLLPQLVTSILSMLPTLLTSAINLFMQIVEAVVTAIPQIIEALVSMLPSLITTLIEMIPGLIEASITLFVQIALAFLQALPKIIVAVITMLPKIVTTLITMIPTLIQAAIQLFLAIVTGVIKAIPQIIKAVQDMWPKIQSEFGKMGPKLIQAGMEMINGLVKGITANAGQVIDSLVGMAGDAVNAFKNFLGIKSPSKAFMAFGRDIIDGLQVGLKKSASSAVTEMSNTAKRIARAMDEGVISRQTGGALTSMLVATTNKIKVALTERAKVIDRLADANKRYADLVKERDAFSAKVAEGVSNLGSITSAKTADSMIKRLQDQIAAANKFSETLKALKAAGLDQTSLEELTEKFAQSGDSAAADALLAGGADAVKQVAALRGQLNKAGQSLGTSVGKTLYQAGIDGAKGLVNGLTSQASQLQKTANTLADALAAAFKKRLGIRSPSRLFYGFGLNTLQGYINALTSMRGDVEDAMQGAIGPALGDVEVSSTAANTPMLTRSPVTTTAPAAAVRGGNDIDVNVIGDLHPERTARAVADVLAEKVAVLAG